MIPIVHVVSTHSTIDAILRDPVLNVVGKGFQTLDIPWGPYVPDIKPEYLPSHIKHTSPDLVVLVSEYEDFIDVQNVKPQIKLFRDLLTSVKNAENTQIIFVITSDGNYKEDDLCSTYIEDQVKKINEEILRHSKLKILSWGNSPSPIHLDVITKLLRVYMNITIERQPPKTSNVLSIPEHDSEKGRLRLRAIVENGRLLAILKSEPYCLSKEERLKLQDKSIRKYVERTKFELWEKEVGIFTVCTKSDRGMLRKVADLGPTERRHSLQVFSYHSNSKAFKTMDNFIIKGMNVSKDASPRSRPIELDGLFQSIAGKRPDFVAFSCDIEMLQDMETIQQFIRGNWSRAGTGVQSSIADLKGIIIMVIGDGDNQDGQLVSKYVHNQVDRLASKIPLPNVKVTVMSWMDRPFLAHHDKLNSLLCKASIDSATPVAAREIPTATVGSLPKNIHTEFDPAKGYLRYRAELEHGQVGKVLFCPPPDWTPHPVDLDKIAQNYRDTPKAVLEYWGHSFGGPPNAPVVVPPEKNGWFSKIKSSMSVKKAPNGDYA